MLAAMPRPDDAALRWTTPDQWHATLRFFGSVEEGAARKALDRIDLAAVGTVEAVLGPATGRFGDRIVHVPVSGLTELARAVVDATADIGEPPEPRPFRGHLTLARSRRRRVDLRPFTGLALAGRWPVRDLTLVVSHPHPRGARYEVIATRSLTSDRRQ